MNYRALPVITPKNKNYISDSKRSSGAPCARGDYEREMLMADLNPVYQITWDDAKGNPTDKPGGLFGFSHLGERVEWYIVIQVRPYTERQKDWSKHVGHQGRNVLVLSNKLCDMPWKTFAELTDRPKYLNEKCRIMGTTVIKSGPGPEALWDYVYTKTNTPFDFIDETGEMIFTPLIN